MATFVHLTPEKNVGSITRAGIKTHQTWHAEVPEGVYAMPVVPNFVIAHQWLRELKHSGQRTICGVYVRIPDDEQVFLGHYRQAHARCSAAEALGVIMHNANAEGYEVVIPRKIEANEVTAVRHLPQVLGWRYYPGAHGHMPCGCPVCQPKGGIKTRKIRKAFEE